MSRDDAEDRLDSWKEIASYLGRSVRTAKRWEAEGLPVRRQMHRSQSSVYAYRHEIDDWRHGREVTDPGSAVPERAPQSPAPLPAERNPSEEPGLVVLPFSFHGRDEADAYLADGFTDETITTLSRAPDLRVISRTSSMALRGVNQGVGELARRLAIDFVLEGTVHLSGEQLKVNVRLVDAVADRQLWSSRYQGALDELFDIQERIARRVVEEVVLRVAPDPREGSSRELDTGWSRRPDPNLVAWRCLQRARRQSMRWHRRAIDQAVELLHRGIEEVGERADLCAALGRAHLQYREAALDAGDGPVRDALVWLERASTADPTAPEVAQLAGWIAYARAEIAEAVAQLRVALSRGANEAETLSLLSNCLLISGQTEQARPHIERLLAIDPLTPVNQCMPGFADAMAGRWDGALAPYRRMLEMDPENPLARLFVVWVLASKGLAGDATRVFDAFPAGQESGLPARVAGLFVQALGGSSPGDLSDVENEMTAFGDMLPRLAAQALALAGENERALHWLERAVNRGFIHHPYLAEHDPLLESLRGEEGFVELLKQVEERWRAFPGAVEARVVELAPR